MKIGEQFEITADRYNWVLTERTPGTNKDGEPTTRERQTYHGSLDQACQAALNRKAVEASDGTAEDVIKAVQAASEAIRLTVETAGLNKTDMAA